MSKFEGKLQDEQLNQVAGGSSKEQISDAQVVRAMLGLKEAGVNDVTEAFRKANVEVVMNGDKKANIYSYQGRRISRYEALVRLGRGLGKPNFDIRPYVPDSHGDNDGVNL